MCTSACVCARNTFASFFPFHIQLSVLCMQTKAFVQCIPIYKYLPSSTCARARLNLRQWSRVLHAVVIIDQFCVFFCISMDANRQKECEWQQMGKRFKNKIRNEFLVFTGGGEGEERMAAWNVGRFMNDNLLIFLIHKCGANHVNSKCQK